VRATKKPGAGRGFVVQRLRVSGKGSQRCQLSQDSMRRLNVTDESWLSCCQSDWRRCKGCFDDFTVRKAHRPSARRKTQQNTGKTAFRSVPLSFGMTFAYHSSNRPTIAKTLSNKGKQGDRGFPNPSSMGSAASRNGSSRKGKAGSG
jgi:hypothetical protein